MKAGWCYVLIFVVNRAGKWYNNIFSREVLNRGILEMEQKDRIRYAKRALDGIALGDCFGQTFFVSEEIARQRIKDREILNEPWSFTDDTVMAIGIYQILNKSFQLLC